MWKALVAVVVALVVLVGGGGAVVWFSPLKDRIVTNVNREPPSTPVRIESPERGDLVRTVSAPGVLEPRTVVNISAQVSAKVLALPFREGDRVQAGDVVARLQSRDLVARLEQARAAVRADEARLEGARAQLTSARLEFERVQQLVETGDETQSALDRAEASYLSSNATVLAAQQQIEIARQNITQAEEDLENAIITAPMDGVIISLNTEVGETVLGTSQNAGTVLMQIADMSEMLMKAQVDEVDVGKLSEGQRATVFINAFSDIEYTGQLEFIGRQRIASANGGGFFQTEIVIDMPEDGFRYTGLSANTDIAVETFYDSLRVPSQAVLDRRVEDLPEDIIADNPIVDRDKTFVRVVYRLVDGQAVVTPVAVGPSDLTHTVVLDGLSPDDVVVTGPYRVLVDISHDQRIRDEDAPIVDETEGADAQGGDADGEGGGEEGGEDTGADDDSQPDDDAVAGADTDDTDGAGDEG